MGARDLLADLTGAGLSVTADGDRLVIHPASRLTDEMRSALRAAKSELLMLLAENDNLGTPILPPLFLERRDRLLRWGWAESDANAMADRLANRDHDDDRVSCTDCRHYRPARCANHRRAGLSVAEVGRDLVVMLQRCQGFQQLKQSEAQQ